MIDIHALGRSCVIAIYLSLQRAGHNGQDYPELAAANTSEPIARVCPGGQSTGKLYFDVAGPDPDGVVYRTDFTDLLIWVH